MSERLRELERRHREAPDDLVTLRALADERRRRGEEMLPDVRREDPTAFLRGAVAVARLWRSMGPSPFGEVWIRPVTEYGPGLADSLYPLYVRSRAAIAMPLPFQTITIS